LGWTWSRKLVHHAAVAVGRAERWNEREPKVIAAFGTDDTTARRVAAIFELMEMAWHDCYGEVTPPDQVIDDVLVCSGGKLDLLIDAAQLAVTDWRDLRLRANDLRQARSPPFDDPP
jgi:hypothetical protein